MNVDLEHRLSAMFDRVAGTITVADDPDRVRVRSIEPRRRRTWLPAVAAGVVLLAGVAAIVSITVRDDPDRSISQQPADPARPLYVLPDGVAGASVGNGSTGSTRIEPHRGIVVATPDGDGFVDPVAIQISNQPASDTESTSPTDADLPFPVVASMPRDDVVLSAIVNLPSVQQALASVDVADDGTLTLPAGSPLTVLETFDSPEPYVLHSTYSEVTPESGDYVVVETVNLAGPLVIPTAGGNTRLERDTVQGRDAWHLSRTDADGEWHGLAWSHAPFQVIYVTGHEPLDTVREVAESLDVVDEATWIEATGCDC